MKRYRMLDGLRGVTIISMILYHMIWDMVYLFGIGIGWYRTSAAYVWQQSICWTFILLSGFCFPFGRRKLKRGLTVSAMGLLVMAATSIFMPESRVVFGVLTMTGSCMLLMLPLDSVLRERRPLAGFLCSLLLFFLFRNVNTGYLGFEGLRLLPLPGILYRNWATAYLGFPPADFFSTDYFSLFPWIFLFIAGYELHYLLPEAAMDYLKNGYVKWLEWIGRQSLVIYIIHQPVLMAVLSLLL